jgi:hypothetical protein
MVSTPERVAEAILAAGPGGKAELYVPRPYWALVAIRVLFPALMRRGASRAGKNLTPATRNDPSSS